MFQRMDVCDLVPKPLRSLLVGGLIMLTISVGAAGTGESGDDAAGERGGDRGAPPPATASGDGGVSDEPPVPRSELPEQFLDQEPPGRAAGEFVTDFSRATVDFADVLSGGPPRDGIPSIDRPRFVALADARGWIDPREPVLVIEAETARRAQRRAGSDAAGGTGESADGAVHIYPLQILTWHEIVNDEVGGVPVTVTYCPLCNTGVAFLREVHGAVLSFGTTGRLRFSNLIMYDRESESWWQQASGNGIAGHFAGARLTPVPVLMMPFRDARELWPEARVLSRDTGYVRSYGSNPYVGYDTSDRPFLLRGADLGPGPIVPGENRRLELLDRVVSVQVGEDSTAVSYRLLERERVVQRRVGGARLVFLWSPGTASALDERQIAAGRDVGSANAFFARTRAGDAVDLRRSGDAVVDRETGSEWNVAGLAVAGPRRGDRLEPAPGVQHFWFSHATLVGEPGE